MTQAVDEGVIVKNPVSAVKIPATVPRVARFLTAEQLHNLATAAEDRQDGAGLAVEVLGWVGLRWGELVALRASRVDVAALRVTVADSATEVAGRLVFGTPKTHRTRVVAIPAPLAARLARHLGDVEPDGLVFTAAQGGPLRGRNWRQRVFAPAVAATGLDPKLRPHDLRHTAASVMIASGASIKAVQRQLGHASAAMTLDRYGHLYPDELDTLAAGLGARYTAAAEASREPGVAQGGHTRFETITE